MSVNSDASRSVREEAHQKLDALLYSISSRQLERVYGVSPKHDDDDDAESTPAPPLPPSRQSPPAPLISSQQPQRRRGEGVPPSVRWKDDEETIPHSDLDYDVIGDRVADRVAFPPLEDFRKKLSDLRRKRQRDEDLAVAAAAAPGGPEITSDAETLTPYVDALLNYVHFLEKEKSGFSAELEKLRRTLGVVANENAHLHKEIKRGFLEAVVNAGNVDNDADDDGVRRNDDAATLLESEMRKMTKRHELETKRWKDKAEDVEREMEETKAALKAAEERAEASRDEAERSRGTDAQRIVESLLNERNSLSKTVMEMSRKMTESKAREEALTNKLKKTLSVADQSLFEKDEMALREEKARRELEEERTRWEEEERRREEERKGEKERSSKEAANRFAELEEALATAEGEVIKLAEKLTTMENRREGEKEEKRRAEEEKEEAEENRERFKGLNVRNDGPTKDASEEGGGEKGEKEELVFQRKQTEERLRQEIVNYEAKTRCLERELTKAREECVKTHERMAEVEREAGLARLQRETMAKFRFDDAKDTREEADRRIDEAKKTADAWKEKYAGDVEELKTFAGRQSDLITRLKEECVSLTSTLESVSARLESESQSRRSEAERADQLLRSKSNELKREKQRSKKLGDSARKLKKDGARLTSVVSEQKAQILEMTDAVAKAIAGRQMQAKENEFLRQIHLPTPTHGRRQHLGSASAASSTANRLITPPPFIVAPPMTTTAAAAAKSMGISDPDVRLSTSFNASVEDESQRQ